jgi:hypothetical protein
MAKIKSDGRTITVRVPISIRKRGGRKVVLAPDGTVGDARKLFCQQVDSAMVKALARAFRWRELLEAGKYTTIREMAAAERINHSYIARVLRLSLLAPDIIESIIDGRQPQSPRCCLPASTLSAAACFPAFRAVRRRCSTSAKLRAAPRRNSSMNFHLKTRTS